MNELQECPYCKDIAKIKKRSVDLANSTIHDYYVECTKCGASTERYNTYFAYFLGGKSFYHMTEKEAINKAVCDWNKRIFNVKTRLAHMTDQEKLLWHIEDLLCIAWYGAMVPMDSIKWKTAWKLREIAESKRLLSLRSKKNYDLGEVANVLAKDIQVMDLVISYLKVNE